MTKCPACKKPGGAITADPHCRSKTCTWNKCKCGVTYDRGSGIGFSAKEHFPAEGNA